MYLPGDTVKTVNIRMNPDNGMFVRDKLCYQSLEGVFLCQTSLRIDSLEDNAFGIRKRFRMKQSIGPSELGVVVKAWRESKKMGTIDSL